MMRGKLGRVLSSAGLAVLSACAVDTSGAEPAPPQGTEVKPEGIRIFWPSSVTLLSDGTVDIECGTGTHVASVFWYQGDTTTLGVTLDSTTYTFAMNPFFFTIPAPKSIRFNGYIGNDSFTNGTYLPSVVHGGGGNDTLVGGSGADVLYGDDGDDAIWGNDGNDTLYGGPGTNSLYGGNGQDTIISVGFGSDTVLGGTGLDFIWADTTDRLLDVEAAETSLGYLHKISGFQPISYTGGQTSTAVGLNPSGGPLPNPLATAADLTAGDTAITTFSGYSLFRPTGPNKDDAFQGLDSLGDCYFISHMAAMADTHPDFIRNLIADLGDGTYAVRFFSNGSPIYYRVDNELWTELPVTTPAVPRYAKLNGSNINGAGAIWVPIVEKALTFARFNTGTYDAIAGGNPSTLPLFGGTVTNWVYPDGYTNGCDSVCTATQNWYAAGQPAGAFATNMTNYVNQFLTWVQAKRAANQALLCGAVPGVSDTVPISDPNNFRNPAHIYMIDHVTTDAYGKPNGIVVRDPWGLDRQINDYAHIYYLIGGANWFQATP